jgi:hypothetical protein
LKVLHRVYQTNTKQQPFPINNKNNNLPKTLPNFRHLLEVLKRIFKKVFRLLPDDLFSEILNTVSQSETRMTTSKPLKFQAAPEEL